MPDRLLVIPGTLPGLNEYIAAETRTTSAPMGAKSFRTLSSKD